MEQKLKLIPKNKKGSRIHIKPENRGKFTEYCGGKVTSECIAKGKRSSNPTIRKRATFAANARKWKKKHQYGGPIFYEDNVLNPEALYTQSWNQPPQEEQELTPGQIGMMKARMAMDSHFGNPTARRLTNYDTRTYKFPEYIIPADPVEGNAMGNVYMGSFGNVIIPGIKDVNGTLSYVDDFYALPEQNMYFDSDKDADIFGRNYKKIAPMMYQQDGPLMYNQNTQSENPAYESPKVWLDYWYSNRPKEIYQGNQAYAALHMQHPFEEIMYGTQNPLDINVNDWSVNAQYVTSHIVPQEYMDSITGREGVSGFAPYAEDSVYYIPQAFQDYPIQVHEHVHKLRKGPHLLPHHKTINAWLQTMDHNDIFNEGITPDYSYLDEADEIYARLMESRRRNNLDPQYIVTEEDLEKMRSDPENSDLFDRYKNKFLLNLYNNIY